MKDFFNNTTFKNLIEDMTKQEKEDYNYLMNATTKDNPNLKEMVDDFWKCYYYDRKSPLYEHGYLDK